METKDFDSLINQLGSNLKCILVLGPEFINIDLNESDFTESIHDYLAKRKFSELSKKNYFGEDGFLYYEDEDDNLNMLSTLSAFYRDLTLTASYTKLARIPFTTIISLSPDDLIIKAYEQINKDKTFRSYKNEGFEDGPLETSKSKPLIYNLTGHYDNAMNLVYTFDNLFTFFNKIFQDTVFPNVRKHIIEANNFLFLGFNYDKWYLKLIFFLLNKFRQDKQKFSRNAIYNYKIDNDVLNTKIDYYRVSFKMKFSPENEKEFIDKLFDACREKGILSEPNILKSPTSNTSINQYKILFLSASPSDKLRLSLGPEYDDIKNALNHGIYQLLPPVYNLKKDGVREEVNNTSPSLIYITCHGTAEGELILSTQNNTSAKLPLKSLVEIVNLLIEEHKQLSCIVFSACKSKIQAKEISTVIPYCIGMSENIDEDVSMIFTKGFFQAFIRDKQNIEYAFKNGISAIKNCGDSQLESFFNIPILYKNGEIFNV